MNYMKNISVMKVATMILFLLLGVPFEGLLAQRVGKDIRGNGRGTREMLRERYGKAKNETNREKPTKNDSQINDAEINKEKDDVELVVSGEGSSKDEATFSALRSAIEQTFGTFVSSNTSIVNDELTKDEIVSVSSGNVKRYKVIYEKEENGKYYITLNAVISIGKLVSFAQSKGAETELAGATFAMNLKMMELNKRNEETALSHLYTQISEICQTVSPFDYLIDVAEPKITHDNKINCKATIQIIPNQNAETIKQLISNTIGSLNLSEEEREKMKNMGMTVYLLPKNFYNSGEFGGDPNLKRAEWGKDFYYLRTNMAYVHNSLHAIFDVIPKYDFVIIDDIGTYMARKGNGSRASSDIPILFIGERGEATSTLNLDENGNKIYHNKSINGLNFTDGSAGHYPMVCNLFQKEHLKASLFYTQEEIGKISNIRVEPLVSAPSIEVDSIDIKSPSDIENAIKILSKYNGDSITVNGRKMKTEDAKNMMEERLNGRR